MQTKQQYIYIRTNGIIHCTDGRAFVCVIHAIICAHRYTILYSYFGITYYMYLIVYCIESDCAYMHMKYIVRK